MTTRNLKQDIDPKISIASALQAATVTGSAVTIGANESATIIFTAATITDGTHTPSVLESATLGGSYTAVAAADLDGSLAALASDTTRKIAYMGKLGFIKAKSTVTGSPSTGGVYGANVILGHPKSGPVA